MQMISRPIANGYIDEYLTKIFIDLLHIVNLMEFYFTSSSSIVSLLNIQMYIYQ